MRSSTSAPRKRDRCILIWNLLGLEDEDKKTRGRSPVRGAAANSGAVRVADSRAQAPESAAAHKRPAPAPEAAASAQPRSALADRARERSARPHATTPAPPEERQGQTGPARPDQPRSEVQARP